VTLYVLEIVINVLAQVQNLTVKQILLSVLETVISVLVQIQNITVHQMLFFVLAIVIFVLVLTQHIAVQKVMLFDQIILVHVVVRVVIQFLIANHVRLHLATVALLAVVIISVMLRELLLILVEQKTVRLFIVMSIIDYGLQPGAVLIPGTLRTLNVII